MNIFQKAITPDMPRVLEGEQIYVYVPQATSTNAGIASYKNADFKVNDGVVSLRWPIQSIVQGPLATPSLIKVQDTEFEYSNANVELEYEGSTISSTVSEIQIKRDLRDAYNRPDLVMLDPDYFIRTIVEKNGKQYYKHHTTAVHYNMSQKLSDSEQAQARLNINSASNNDIATLNNKINKLLQTGVYSINGKTGDVVLTTSDISNTSDYTTNEHVNKLIDGINTNKADVSYVDEQVGNLNLNKADINYVDQRVAGLVGSAPDTLDTLAELASALKNNDDIVTVLEESIATKANKTDLNNYLPTTTVYIKTASISGNALTLTKQDNTTLEFVGEPTAYIKTASVNGNALTLTKQDNSTLEFVGEPSAYIKTASVSGTTLTLTDKAGTAITFGGGVYKGTCSTGTTAYTKIVDCPGFVLQKGAIIDVTFTHSNGTVVELNVNNTGAIDAYYYEIGLQTDYETVMTRVGGGDKSIPYGGWGAGDTVRFFYDGNYWIEIMNLTYGIPYSIPYQAINAYKSRTQDITDNSTKIATTAFVHTAIDAALEAGTGSEDIYLPLAGGQMTGQLKLDSSGILFPNVYRLSGEGIMPNANTSQFKMYKPGDAFTKGLVYNYASGVVELIARPTVNGTEVALTTDTPDLSGYVSTALAQREFGMLVPRGTYVPEKSNLNTVTFMKVGNYYCSVDKTVATLTNCPTSSAFMMQVLSPLSTTYDNESGAWVYRVRILTTYMGGVYYQNCSTNGSGTWSYGAWRKMLNSGGGAIDSGCTLTINGTLVI